MENLGGRTLSAQGQSVQFAKSSISTMCFQERFFSVPRSTASYTSGSRTKKSLHPSASTETPECKDSSLFFCFLELGWLRVGLEAN